MVDIVVPQLAAIPLPGGLIYAPQGITLNVGGHSANVSIDLAQLGQKDVYATGCIGKDLLGEYVLKALKKAGVTPCPQILHDKSTAKNIALIVEGEDKRFIAELAANTLLTPDHVLNLLGTNPKILFIGTVGGLQLVDEALVEILSAAHDAGAMTVVDVINPFESNWEHLTKALGNIDLLHMNGDEANGITGSDSPLKAIRILRNLGAKKLVITNASGGLVAMSEESVFMMPAFTVEEVDPTGAGDALCAGLIHNLLSLKYPQKATLDEFKNALIEGQAAGAACVTEPGATTAVTFINVNKLISEQGENVLKSTIHYL